MTRWSFSLILFSSLFLGCQSSHAEKIKPLENQLAMNQPILFTSDRSWDTVDSSGKVLGKAQYVCLNKTTPLPCPPGARIYRYPSPGGWSANLTSIPGARWIWGPESVMSSTPAANSSFSFRKTISLPKKPVFGFIQVAADDSATIAINGSPVGDSGSISDIQEAASSQSILKTYDIRAFLRAGKNEIVVRAQNGPDSFAGGSGADSWRHNPAGVVFGGWIYCGNPPAMR
jgi:hypothetical protein